MLKQFARLAIGSIFAFAVMAAQAQESNPPVITHTPPAQPVLIPASSLPIDAKIEDESDLAATPIFWRIHGTSETTYNTAAMVNSSGDDYSFSIPGGDLTTNGLDYYIQATDQFGNVGNSGTAANPHVLTTQFVPPAITFNFGSVTIANVQQGTSPGNTTASIRNSGRGTLNYTITTSETWVSVSPSSGTSTGETDQLTVSFSTAGLSVGEHTADLIASDPAASNSPVTGTVKVIIVPPPAIELNKSVINHNIVQGSGVANDTFTIRNTGAGTLNYTLESSQSWLSVSPTSGTATGETDTITISYSTSALAPGNYFANIVATDDEASNSPQAITINLSVATPPPSIVLSTSALAPSATEGSNAANQSFTVRNGGGGTVNYTISDDAPWLSLSPASGSSTGEADTITVQYATSGLAPGSYSATITVGDSNVGNSPQTIDVGLTINFAAPSSLVKRYTFDVDAEGWVISNPSAVFKRPYQLIEPGFLALASDGDNDVTYGYYVSPANGFLMQPFDPMADSTQTGELWQRQGTHYLLRYYVRRTSADKVKAPILRIRANSSNFESYHDLIVQSVADSSEIPQIFNSQVIDFLFQPHPLMYNLASADRTYYLAFDLINADLTAGTAGDDINGGYILDRVEVYAVPLANVQTVSTLKTWDFETAAQFNDWQFFTFPASYSAPTPSTGGGALQAQVTAPANTYGNWQNVGGTLNANTAGQSGKLFIRTRALLRADESSGFKVPEQRLRVMPTDFTSVAETGVLDITTATFIPSLNNNRYVYSYIAVPAKYSGGTMPIHAAWDTLSFESYTDATQRALYETSTQKIYMDEVKVDLVRILSYP